MNCKGFFKIFGLQTGVRKAGVKKYRLLFDYFPLLIKFLTTKTKNGIYKRKMPEVDIENPAFNAK